jgi:flagellar biosynthesis/type III secretory pathway protein FliH
MDEHFIALADRLRPSAPLPPPAPPPAIPTSHDELVEDAEGAYEELLRDVRLFRAHLADALDAMRERLLVALAGDVLARELHLAPVDVDALARRLVDERTREGPIRLRVAPEDVARVHVAECAVVADPTLLVGDAVLECDGGAIDARLGVRLADVLRGLR